MHLADVLSKATYIAFQGTHFYSFLLSLGFKPMTLVLQAPTLNSLSNRTNLLKEMP